MVSGPNRIAIFGSSIFAIAGFYTDYDRLQHVVAASDNGNVFEVHWDPVTLDPSEVAPGYPPVKQLGHFDNSVTIAGFFTPNDKYHHAVVGTRDGNLHEFYYRLDESLHITETHKTDLPLSFISGFHSGCGMASFYSPYDNLRHVVIVDSMGKLEDITWISALSPVRQPITIPLSVNQIASISGFLSHDENPNTRHIIVAQNDHGQIYDIDYPDENHVPSTVGQDYVKTRFDYPVRNVTAFFSSDNNYRHIVVLTRELGQDWLKLRAYDTYGCHLIEKPPISLTSIPGNVADSTSFYNAHDQLCHVLCATQDGSLYEFTYTSQ
ncbi:MAG TPA: hypothetical protein VNW73_15090 [Ktedonobacteraceae bacterium]|nr:hypothetical protein [Ktedonobacteraceae bacterium]